MNTITPEQWAVLNKALADLGTLARERMQRVPGSHFSAQCMADHERAQIVLHQLYRVPVPETAAFPKGRWTP